MAEQNQQNKNEEKDLNQLLKVRREKLKDLQDNGKDPFQITKFDVTAHSSEIKDNFEQMDGKEVTIAGRMMSKRVMGKASFCNVQDLKGNIHVWNRVRSEWVSGADGNCIQHLLYQPFYFPWLCDQFSRYAGASVLYYPDQDQMAGVS